ncbi:hypothetical protein GCK72_023688 [Caenorhabditis remanei]|uniref:Protein kinase domain-containing protein n=1 Tax=Caenorhabditis remanei TaxID=31234 RepID=A0A6A5FXB0_CAERE|nr:hypothetical protein GCK72_023688 [Caenorhabditis remanei]KAF1747226.1 hypothetical protein GCK72_023688 [Caenorhabditis remanei]
MLEESLKNGRPTVRAMNTPTNDQLLLKSSAIDKKYYLNLRDLEFITKIGSCQFGSVQMGILKKVNHETCVFGTMVAIKSNQLPRNRTELEMLVEKVKMLAFMEPHPNILPLIGTVINDISRAGMLYIVTPLAKYKDLRTFLISKKPPPRNYKNIGKGEKEKLMNAEEVTLTKSDLTAFGLQLADGMEFLARVPCVHRDLACRNILVTENKTIQIGDFGLAKKFNEKYCYK